MLGPPSLSRLALARKNRPICPPLQQWRRRAPARFRALAALGALLGEGDAARAHHAYRRRRIANARGAQAACRALSALVHPPLGWGRAAPLGRTARVLPSRASQAREASTARAALAPLSTPPPPLVCVWRNGDVSARAN